jgi:hypothetical protein
LHDEMPMLPTTRRAFLKTAGSAALAGAASAVWGPTSQLQGADAPDGAPVRGSAEHCIFLWLSGGASQIDTFDPKRQAPDRKTPGSLYASIPTAVRGVEVCEHLPRCAEVLDRMILLRTVHHEVIDEHAAATNRMHTGRPTSETIVYPSIGSVVAHQLGDPEQAVPAYVVMGYPNVTRGPGFLGARYSYLYLTETRVGPAGLKRPDDISAQRQSRREQLLGRLRDDYLRRQEGDEKIQAYGAASAAGFRLAGPQFMSVFDLHRESSALREAYGSEFGQRCLLARRLVQAGVRFIEVSSNLNFVNGTGWDVHNEGIEKQHELIRELDQALATLILDLERHKLLDKTVIAVCSEFGRPPEFDGGGGRGHQSSAFTCVLAGGGLKTGQAIGQTDDIAKHIVQRPISVADFHATIYAALGIDPAEHLYAGSRPVPITDGGQAVREAFSA